MKAFYDPKKSYEENYDRGPFGLFQETPVAPLPKTPSIDFLGYKIDLPFGIPAGPLLNSKFIRAAWKWGFSLPTYKTVRGNAYPCHPVPNVIKVHSPTVQIKPGEEVKGDLNVEKIDVTRDGITNSFGVPSKPVEIWQMDVKQLVAEIPPGSQLILSFMGTKKEGMTFEEYVADFVRTCKLAVATGTKIL